MSEKKLEDINLNLLVVFEAIYSTSNISHAAARLNLSQPTVSNALARLRTAVGDQLFVRDGNGVRPTTKAINLAGPVREALRMIRFGLGDAEPFNPGTTKRHFRIVLLDLLEPILIPHVLTEIQDARSVTIEALPFLGTSVADGLNDGTIDLVLATYLRDVPDIECKAVGQSDIVMVCRKGHPRVQGPMTLEHFSTLGHIALVPKLRALTKMDEELRHKSIDRHIVYCVTKFWSFPHIIANSDLIAMLPGDFARSAAQVYPLDIHPLPFELQEQNLYLSWKKTRETDPGLAWLRDRLLSAYSATL